MGFKLKAADGTALEIADGDFYFNTKARGRRMMANSLSSDARRVYACLELATMGFQQEECVVAIGKNQTRPLTPTDIKDQTGLSRQNVRRAFEELDDAGLAERRAADGGALRKGQVLIYSWAVPRQPKKEDCSRARLQFPGWFPESWEPLKPLISRFKYSLIDDEAAARDYKEELDAAARDYKEAEIVAIRALERVCAGRKRADASLYLERTERTVERTTTSAVPATSGEDVVVAEKLGIKKIAARKFLAACRSASPDCTVEEIGAVIDQVNRTIDRTRIRNPTGVLLENVPLKIAAAKKLNDEWKAANTVICWSCHGPIYPEDARIRGAHQKCWDEEERREMAQMKGVAADD